MTLLLDIAAGAALLAAIAVSVVLIRHNDRP